MKWKLWNCGLWALALLPLSSMGNLEFAETQLKLEAGLLDERIEPVFKFRNTGETPVRIIDLKSSCGCTVPELEKRVYDPGESGEIKAVFTIGSRVGLQHKTVGVVTDEADSPEYLLSFETDVPQWYKLEPRILTWRIGQENDPREVVLNIPHPDKVKVPAIPLEGDNFTVTEKSAEPGKYVYTVVLKEAPDKRVTEKLSFMLVATEGGRQSQREALLYCMVR